MGAADPLILAIDQGTSSTKVLAVDRDWQVVGQGAAPLAQEAPRPSWVEHDAHAVIESVRSAVIDCGRSIDLGRVEAIGISNQRESLLLWDRVTGEPRSPVLSWQDRRTIEQCDALVSAGHGPTVQRLSGLPLDPMFSAVKAAWLFDHVDPDRTHAAELCLGTIDSWLMWHLTGEHVIEAGNASRTSLVDLSSGQWSDTLLAIFDIPRAALPPIIDSCGALGIIRDFAPIPAGIPVTGILGDSHAALLAHVGHAPGTVKATFGTGSSLMTLAPAASGDAPGLCRTIAWRLPGEPAAIALEANILSAGSTLTWLAGILGATAGELVAQAAADSGGVALVPAFNGLGAPWWDSDADALLIGMSLATTRAELARAALDSVVLQACDVVSTFIDAGVRPEVLAVDGGISANRALMQRLANLAALPVAVSKTAELSALGAARAARLGLAAMGRGNAGAAPREYDRMVPEMADEERARLLDLWHEALARSQSR